MTPLLSFTALSRQATSCMASAAADRLLNRFDHLSRDY
jgi:hypothetical protein